MINITSSTDGQIKLETDVKERTYWAAHDGTYVVSKENYRRLLRDFIRLSDALGVDRSRPSVPVTETEPEAQ
jgi:hypothetical protein